MIIPHHKNISLLFVQKKKHYFGKIKDGEMLLNELGKYFASEIQSLETKRKNVEIHKYIVMPNHVHILMILNERNENRNDKNVQS